MSLSLAPGQTLEDLNVAAQIVRSGRNTVLAAPVWARAGHAVIAALRAQGRRFVYLSSLKPLADIAGTVHGIPVHHADAERTFASELATIPYHLDKFAHEGRVLVWDKASWLITDYGFRPDQVDKVIPFMFGLGFSQVIVLEDGLLRNDDPLRVRSGKFERVEVDLPVDLLPVHWIPFEDLTTALLDSVRAQPDRPHLISLFSKKGLKDKVKHLLECVEAETEFGACEVTVYNSEEGSRKNAQSAFAELNQQGAAQVVLTTYKAGIQSAVNPVIHIASLVGVNHSPNDMQQIAYSAASAHEQPEVRMYYNFPVYERPEIDLTRYEAQLRRAAESRIETYRSMFKDPVSSSDHIRELEKSDYGGTRTPDHQRLVRSDLSVNSYQIRHHVYMKYVENAYASPAAMGKALSEYGMSLVVGKRHERLLVAPMVKVELDGESFEKEVDLWFANRIGVSKDIADRAYLLTCYFSRDDAKAMMLRYGRGKVSWSMIRDRILAQRPLLEEEAEVRDRVYEEFCVGEELSGNEIRNRMLGIAKVLVMVTNSEMTNVRAVQALRRYFETKSKKRRIPADAQIEGGPLTERVHLITDDYPLPYPMLAKESAQ